MYMNTTEMTTMLLESFALYAKQDDVDTHVLAKLFLVSGKPTESR